MSTISQIGGIRVVKDQQISTIVFDDPQRHNAMSIDMWEKLAAALHELQADPTVRVCVLEGGGDAAFVSGNNLNDVRDRQSNVVTDASLTRAARAAWRAMDEFEKPLIAKIQGYCLGAGVGIATKADLRIASTKAVFGVPAARIGLGYPLDLLRSLVALVGPATAKMIMFTAQRIDAAAALRMGLVDEVTEPAQLDAKVHALATQIAENAPLTLRAAKVAIDHLVGIGAHDVAALEKLVQQCMQSADHAEGLRALREKRKPQFIGS